MQDLSFHFNTGRMDVFGYPCELYIHTFENVYAVAKPDNEQADEGTRHWRFTQAVWAGGQERIETGPIVVTASKQNEKIVIAVSIQGMPHKIRCVKLVLHGLPEGCIANKLDGSKPKIDENGLLLKYPEGWRTLDTAMAVLEHDNGFVSLRSLDKKIRDKRFVLFKRPEGTTAELIFEEQATDMTCSLEVPEWEVSFPKSLYEAYAVQIAHIQTAFDLKTWEERSDVPGWAKEIALVAALHGQHWCGYMFNTYQQMLEAIQWLAERLEGRRILAYLPGWEGRYYWRYGAYAADERMGGEDGLHRLAEGARKLGVRLMPMFGINIVNGGLPNYEQWGAPSEFRTASGNQYGGSVDWDASRHYDHATNRSLNPAAPGWQERLVTEIHRVLDTYGFDAVFLDIAAVWYNDPSHTLYPGILRLMEKLRENHPELLICGEGWYDGLAAALPVVQSGHTDGPMHYHDAIHAPFFDTWCRTFAHLCLGDPSRGSTGVHELGTNRYEWRTPVRKGVWPTVTIVNGTLEKAPQRVEEIIEDAKCYIDRFLSK